MLNPTAPTAPPAGSIVDHFGVVVKDLPAELQSASNFLPRSGDRGQSGDRAYRA